MKVSYESTVREMDAEELEAEYENEVAAYSAKEAKHGVSTFGYWKYHQRLKLISDNYQQLTGKPLTNGHLPTVL